MSADQTTASDSIRTQINRIIYLASLVSNPQRIDAYLDPMRRITSGNTANEKSPQGAQAAATLSQIEHELTEYLLKSEPLRAFTAESLQQRVYERFEAPKLIRRLRLLTAGVISLTVALVLLVIAMPFSTLPVRVDVGLVLGIAVCYMGGMFLFLSALKHFSPEARRGYRILSVGFAIGSISLLINAVLTLLYEAKTPWENLWPLNLGVYAQYIAIYLGSVTLARVQGVQSVFTNIWVVGAVSALVGALLLIPPVGRQVEAVSGLVLPLAGAALVLTFAAVELLRRIWKASAPLYQAPSKSLWLTFLVALVGWTTYCVSQFLPSAIAKPMGELKISSLVFIVATALLVWSAYRFNKLSRY